jgi:lysophospholipase L1-like esterase
MQTQTPPNDTLDALPFVQPRRVAPWRYVVGGIVALVFIALAAEGLARVWELKLRWRGIDPLATQDRWFLMLEPADDTLYRLKPGDYEFYAFRVNNLNGRGYDVREAKPPGTVRILALGDSTVFGYGASEGEQWSAVAGRILREKTGVPVQVVNQAQIASSSHHVIAELERLGDRLDVDALLVGIGAFNDYTYFAEAPGRTEAEVVADGTFRTLIEEAQTGWQSLALHRAWRRVSWRRHTKRADARLEEWLDEGRFREDAPGEGRRVPPGQFRENIRTICDWAAGRGVPVFFATHELHPDHREKWAVARQYRRLLVEEAEARGAVVIPGAEALRELAEEADPDIIWWDWVHVTKLGNRAIGEAAADAMLANWDAIAAHAGVEASR